MPSPPCEDVIDDVNTKVECKRCVLGKTFSDDFGTGHCKFCTVCDPDQVVKHNCTLTANKICDTKCRSIDTYYDDMITDDCQKCSKCCGLSSDKREQECVNKAMPSDQQCNVNTATRCKTKPSKLAPSMLVYSSNEKSMQPLNSTWPTIIKRISTSKAESLTTKISTNDKQNTEKYIVIAVCVIAVCLTAVIILIALLVFVTWKRRFCSETRNSDGNLSKSEGGDSLESDVTTDGDGYPLLSELQ